MIINISQENIFEVFSPMRLSALFCGLNGTLLCSGVILGKMTVIFRGPLKPSTFVSCGKNYLRSWNNNSKIFIYINNSCNFLSWWILIAACWFARWLPTVENGKVGAKYIRAKFADEWFSCPWEISGICWYEIIACGALLALTSGQQENLHTRY